MSESSPAASVARLAGKGGRYHHGRLRGALLVAAAQILEAEGEAGLTLRGLADRAGVSRTAPYRHFADKRALLGALAEQGFAALGRALDGAAQTSDSRLVAVGRAYLAFARRYRDVFRLMTGDRAIDAAILRQGEAAIRDRFAAATENGGGPDRALAAYALVHGLAVLGGGVEEADAALAAGLQDGMG